MRGRKKTLTDTRAMIADEKEPGEKTETEKQEVSEGTMEDAPVAKPKKGRRAAMLQRFRERTR